MSNYLAIATVTMTLQQILQQAISAAGISNFSVTTNRPDASQTSGVNIYLYQVAPNAALRNADLPTRDENSRLIQRPAVALDLHYLISFYGSEENLLPQQLLGVTAAELHRQAMLTRDTIRDSISRLISENAARYGYLQNSDLVRQIDLVRLAPLSLNLEELSKLWSVFFQTSYALSMAYQASVILIESPGIVREGLPVLVRNIVAIPFQTPAIDQIVPQILDFVSTATVEIRGQNLSGGTLAVLIGGLPVAIDSMHDTTITARLPAAIKAGVNTVSVVSRPVLSGAANDPLLAKARQAGESNMGVFLLIPAITIAANATTARGSAFLFNCAPAIQPGQVASLFLGDMEIPLGPVASATTAPQFAIPAHLPVGTYLVRLRVDGAQSRLTVDNAGVYDGPLLKVT